MDDFVLKITGLTKKYKNVKVLDDISMEIKKGQIYGLIGLNGAGKSTLIRVITGLAAKDMGNIELFGEKEERKIESARGRIGAIIETPGLYEDSTVYENMYINRIQKGIPGNESVEKLLKLIGLEEIKNKKVKTLSMGTKQRLGIAMALLGEPELLILDEPTNGLDPIGIIEMRELIKKLNLEYAMTILISSHILTELYQLANCYGIIHNGKLIEQISADVLNESCRKFVHIKVDDAAKAAVILNEKLKTSNFEVLPSNIIKLYDYVDNSGLIATTLVREKIVVEELMPMKDDLETYFSKVIGGYDNA